MPPRQKSVVAAVNLWIRRTWLRTHANAKWQKSRLHFGHHRFISGESWKAHEQSPEPEGDDPIPKELAEKPLIENLHNLKNSISRADVAEKWGAAILGWAGKNLPPHVWKRLISSHVLEIIWIFPQYNEEESHHDSALHAAVRLNTSRRKGGKWQTCREINWLTDTLQRHRSHRATQSERSLMAMLDVTGVWSVPRLLVATPKHRMSQEISSLRCMNSGLQTKVWTFWCSVFIFSWNTWSIWEQLGLKSFSWTEDFKRWTWQLVSQGSDHCSPSSCQWSQLPCLQQSNTMSQDDEQTQTPNCPHTDVLCV